MGGINLLKFKRYIVALFLITILTLIPSCNNNTKTIKEIKYDFGIISTIAHKESSVISYYNLEGELKKKENLKLAWLGMGFGSFGDNDKSIYVKVDNKNGTIFALNKQSGEYKLYDLSYNALTIYADDAFIYYSNSNTQVSTISKFNIKENTIKEIKFEKSIITAIYPYQEHIYVTAISKKDDSVILYILDKNTLEVKYKVINKLNCNIFRIHGTHDRVYFANNGQWNNGMGSNILTEYNIKTNSFYEYKLNCNYLYDIWEYNGSLIITHLNPPETKGKNVTLFNLETKELKDIELENDLINCTIKDDVFISCDKDYAYLYSIPEFKLINKFKVRIKGHYITTIFKN